jgi:hypothetical protein
MWANARAHDGQEYIYWEFIFDHIIGKNSSPQILQIFLVF